MRILQGAAILSRSVLSVILLFNVRGDSHDGFREKVGVGRALQARKNNNKLLHPRHTFDLLVVEAC